jgi:hypothetical protein
MTAIMNGRWVVVAWIAISSAWTGTSHAVDREVLPDVSATQGARPVVILRLSSALITAQLDPGLDMELPIAEEVLGTPVSGTARMVGEPSVHLEPSGDIAHFHVVFSGTVFSRTVGRNGPAVIYGHSVTRFTATKEVVFEPGIGFRGLPTKVAADALCFTDGIAATRGGLIGRMVQRRAAREVAEQHQAITAIAKERAARRVASAFNQRMDRRLAELNRTVELRTLLAGLGDLAQSPRLVCCTTPHFLQIASAGFAGAQAETIVLPSVAAASHSRAPVEIWIHESLLPEKIGTALQAMFATPDQSGLVNALALLPGTLGKQMASSLAALVSESKMGVQNLGQWTVVELNPQLESNLVVAGRAVRRE